ncbi:MAG: ROK family protein [Crocinitomicaceae bacterium]|nr:ROK family protein [Crocinitomicaceae bacterium]
MEEPGLALGIDIGGTNTAFGIVDHKGTILFEGVTSTKSHERPESLADFIFDTLGEHSFREQLIGIGIGAPNGNHFTGNIEFAPNLHWKGIVPMAKIFMEKFNKKTIMTNDANAAAVGEMLFGAAIGLKNFVTITLGTGLGSGVVIDGKIVYGEDGLAGEYGHIRVVDNGRLCGCGRQGCLETYASATGVVRSIRELESDYKKDSVLLTLKTPTSKDVAEASVAGDEFSREILDYTAKILGNALADFLCFSNPKAYILFGGCAQAGKTFSDKVKSYMELAALKIYQNKVEVKISELQDRNAAVLGTAAIVFSGITK